MHVKWRLTQLSVISSIQAMLNQAENKTSSIQKLQDSILAYLRIEKMKQEYRQGPSSENMETRRWKWPCLSERMAAAGGEEV